MPFSLHEEIEIAIQGLRQIQTPAVQIFFEKTALLMAETFKSGGKILVAGNGGSLCDAQHFVEEMTGIFQKKRPPLPAIAFADPGHLTCVANDIGFDEVFARSVEGLGRKGDLFFALTTSGNSRNLIEALIRAKQCGLKTVAFLGKGGGPTKGLADLEWVVEELKTTDRIQEMHMTVLHLLIKRVEEILFPEPVLEPLSHRSPVLSQSEK